MQSALSSFGMWRLFAYLFLCVCAALTLPPSALYPLLLFICGSGVARTWALSIPPQRRSLPANPLAVILRYIYVLGAERRLAGTCVREVVALMEFYTWQPSRQRWYVFKILSRNKTRFCCSPGPSGAVFVSDGTQGPRG